MKERLSTIILVGILVVGICLILYPSVSSYWNARHQSRAISQYTAQVEELGTEDYAACLSAAQAYNETLANSPTRFQLSDAQTQVYDSLLSVTDDGIMGYLEIPAINCYLPIYHGTEETTLQSGVGHLAGSSLPVGGESTHCVLSGHRGLPSSRLLTDLNKVVEGDRFLIHVLDETLTYEVDQILIVEPSQTESLVIQPGEDLCTLVTCTPYGINTHRLLVRGHRVPNDESETGRVTANAVQVDPTLVASVIAVPLVILVAALLLVRPKKDGRKPRGKNKGGRTHGH